MRSFEQRMEQIRSRSKARIAHRRKVISAVCTPLALCLAVSVIWFSAWNPGASPTALGPTPTTLQNLNTVDVLYVVNSATGEIVCPASASEDFLAYVSQLDTHADRTQPFDASQHGFTSATGTLAIAPINLSYYITVTDAEGITQKFTLKGTTLYNNSADAVYALNSVEYKQLVEILSLDAFMNGE